MTVPLRGADVGTWDVPMNGNFTLLDSMLGGVTTIVPIAAPVTLASTQAQSNVLRFTGTLTANVAVTLPGIYKSWTLDNQLSNSPSSYYLTLVSTSGTSIIGVPPGTNECFYDGTTVKYRNLGHIGQYLDYASSAVPNWVTACTNQPYLNCDGTVISSATYPQLVNLLGTTTLPDSRGRTRFALNGATSRITSSGGIDGTTIYAAGGVQNISNTLGSSNLPASIPYKDSGHAHNLTSNITGTTATKSFIEGAGTGIVGGGGAFGPANTLSVANSTNINITINPSTAAAGTGAAIFNATLPPGYVGGITMIRTGL